MTGLGSSCGACKFLRRKCTKECVFAPYFSCEQAASQFASVHKVFGASNVSKLLLQLPVECRSDAVITITYEALARMRDPIYGCVAYISVLQQQIANLQEEIEILIQHMATFTVGIASDGSPTTSNPNNEIHNFSPEDAMNNQYYQSELGAQVNNSGYTTESQAFGNHVNLQMAPSFKLEDQNLFCDFQTNPLDILLEGLNQSTITYCPWLGSVYDAN